MGKRMNELIICRGIRGAGKSSYIKKHYQLYENYEVDQFFIDKDGNYKWDKSLLYEAHKFCQARVYAALAEGKNVAVSNTSLTIREVETYIDIADELNVPYRIIRLTKQFQNVHNVPPETIEIMKRRLREYPGEEVIIDY
jgi:predicted kinase